MGGYGMGGPPGMPGMWGGYQAWGDNSGYGPGYNPGFNQPGPGQGKKKNKNKNKNGVVTETYAEKAAKNLPGAKQPEKEAAAPKVEAAQPLSPEDWPPSLKKYVSRCFEKCTSNVDKDMVEVILKGKITSAASSGSLFKKDWDNEPLPSSLSSKLAPSLGDTSSRGKVYRGGGRGRGGYATRGNRPEIFNKKLEAKADFGQNPNHVPLGGNSKNSNKKGNKGGKTPHFYKNPMHMDIEGDLGSSAKKMKRAARFAGDSPPPVRRKTLNLSSLNDKLMNSDQSWEDRDGIDWAKMHIVGTCQKLEKQFLRLTEAPEAHKVRPVEVLKKALKSVRDHWVKKSDYRYACDQLKSIRQDLTVQGVRDSFTVQVYETHARVALEKGDYTEFNQCQSQLKMLYADLGGDNRLEFTAYRILYYMYTMEVLDIMSALSVLSEEEKKDESICHVIKFRDAWSQGNYMRFFKLHSTAPKMAGYLIDWFIDRERKQALTTMIKAYRVGIPVDYVREQLSCSTEEWSKLTAPFGLSYTDTTRQTLDCKTSMAALPLTAK